MGAQASENVTVLIPESLLAEAQSAAAQAGTTLERLIVAATQNSLRRKGHSKNARPASGVQLPVQVPVTPLLLTKLDAAAVSTRTTINGLIVAAVADYLAPPVEANTVSLQARLPSELVAAAKQHAAAEGVSVTAFAAAALDTYLTSPGTPAGTPRATRERVILRVTPTAKAALKARATADRATETSILEAALEARLHGVQPPRNNPEGTS